MLKISNLNVNYGVIRAIHDVCLEIPEKGIYAIVGANGAGKSTLLRSITGLVRPASGNIIFEGEDITGLQTYRVAEKGIALCPEGRRVFKSATVQENLLAGAYTCRNKELINQRMEMVYVTFPRLAERKQQLAGTLSGGEQQMLAIGRSIMSEPKLLLLDEPSMGLAPNLVDLVFEKITEIHKQENIPIILVEQNAEMALSIADYAYVLQVGKLVLQGKGGELLENDEVQKKYLGA